MLDRERSGVHRHATLIPGVFMRVPAALSLAAALVACASAGTTSSKPTTQTVQVVAAGGTAASFQLHADDASSVQALPYPLERVWRVMPSVFDSLGVPIGTMDPARRTVGNTGFKVRGRLKNVPLSRYIDCGNSTQIGPNADSYDVSMAFLATIRATDANSSSLTMSFEAVGRPATFAQEYSQCSSKGLLETRFIEILKSRLGG